MLTRLRVRNFKKFDAIDIELGNAVVLIGANNSGKTTALQALALWDVGLRRWNEKRQGDASPEKRPGVAINRRDLIAIPVPDANLLWRDLHVRNVERALVEKNGRSERKQKTTNIRIEIIVDGVSNDQAWSCGLEFDYANEESFYCRPLRVAEGKQPDRMPIPKQAADTRVAFLPPMSGLAAAEPVWEPGRINVLIGEGQTAQVLRNLCYRVHESSTSVWSELTRHITSLFGVELLPPDYVRERGEITMAYKEQTGTCLDVSSSGRGLQQTLLLLAHLYDNPRTLLLLDEPDAHLEILRQRQIYRLLTDVAGQQRSQIIAASHSEVLLNEAAGCGSVVAFVGRPHRINDRGSQVIKALTDIGWDQYYQAEQTGWVLYLEDATDLAVLRTLARSLGHEAEQSLENPFVRYVATNQPQRARDHFFGLREAKEDLAGIAVFDRLDKELHSDSPLVELMWRRREIENYFCTQGVLLAYARHEQADDLFGLAERERRVKAMHESISEVEEALDRLGKPSPWSTDTKASDDFLDPLFRRFFSKLGLPLMMRKAQYHTLASLLPRSEIDAEVVEKLDAIAKVARNARRT